MSLNWLEIIPIKGKREKSWHRMDKEKPHTTTVKRKGKNKGGRGLVARLKEKT